MSDLVNITFNTDIDERFANTVPAGAASTPNNLIIDTTEFFEGDASSRWPDGLQTSLTVNASSGFNINPANDLYIKMTFMLLENGEYGLIGRRGDKDNNFWCTLDLTTPTSPTLKFYAVYSTTEKFNITNNFASAIPTLTLGKWHTLELAYDGSADTLRAWMDGKHLFAVSTVNSGTVTAGGAALDIGRINVSTTTTPDIKEFKGYLDSVIVNSNTLASQYTGTSDIEVRTWSGGVDKIHSFSSDITPQPHVLNVTSFPNNIPSFANANNQCYIAGIDPMKKTDGTDVKDIGIPKPVGKPTFSAGSDSAGYDYVVTWLDEDLNESPPSDPTDESRASIGNTINQPSGTGDPPSSAVYWRVYRRHESAGQALFYKVSGDIAIATTTFDDTDTVESLTIAAPLLDRIVPPLANYITYYNNRMYYADVKTSDDEYYPTRVYFSDINNLEITADLSWFYVGDDDSEIITGMTTYRGNLIIFKERSIYVVTGDPGANNFNVINLSNSIGCVSHRTIREVGNYLLWFGDEGVYLWSGDATPIIISEYVEPLIERMPDNRKPYATAGVDEELGLYLLSLSIDRTDINDIVLCYNYRDSFKDGEHRWTKWLTPSSCLSQGYIGLGRNQRVFAADYDGRLAQFERGLDYNSGIDFKWKTGRFNPWNTGSNMRVGYATFNMDLVGDASRRLVSAGYQIDETPEVKVDFQDPTSNNFKIRVGNRGEYLSLFVSGEDIRNRIRFYGFTLDGAPTGRR